jgi:tetratricopeptide (TPR) repeat protein
MRLPTKFSRVLAVASVAALLWQADANADAIDHYQPGVLAKANRALQQGNSDRALALLEDRVADMRKSSNQAEGYGLICRAYFQQRDFQVAEQNCDKAVTIGGGASAWNYLNNRGVMRLLLDRPDDALADFRKAAAMNPTERSVRRNMSLAENAQRAQRVAQAL